MEKTTQKSRFPSGDPVLTPQKRIADHFARRREERPRLPSRCILFFFPGLSGWIARQFNASKINMMLPRHPYLLFTHRNLEFACIFPGVGSPLSGLILEESIALGARHFIFLGAAGFLNRRHGQSVIVPGDAWIDEGTSAFYHDEPVVSADSGWTETVLGVLGDHRLPALRGRVWTTDAPYRETPALIAERRRSQCLAVDMEASALFSIARFHGKTMAGFFSPSDIVGEAGWFPVRDPVLSPRSMFELALEMFAVRENTPRPA